MSLTLKPFPRAIQTARDTGGSIVLAKLASRWNYGSVEAHFLRGSGPPALYMCYYAKRRCICRRPGEMLTVRSWYPRQF